nr:carboxylic acid reductase [Expression vector JGI_C7]
MGSSHHHHHHMQNPELGLAEVVATVMDGYADRPAVGDRVTEKVTDPATGRTTLRLLPQFDTLTYREVWRHAGAIASAWQHDPDRPLRAGDFVCTLGFTSSDCATVDLAALRLGAVAVPLQAGASASALRPILAETAPKAVASSIELLDTVVDAVLAESAPPWLIVFDYHPDIDDQRERFEAAARRLAEAGAPTVLEPLAEVISRGETLGPAPLNVPAPDENPLSLLIYTSGSTGTPKGAMYTQSMVRGMWRGDPDDDRPAVTLNFMPMSHIAGRVALIGTLVRGGLCCFTASSDMSTLLEDYSLVRPTELMVVPRVCELVHERFRAEVDRRAIDSADDTAIEEAVRAELREQVFGGRVQVVMCGSAPLAPEIAEFMRTCLRVPVFNGYGATEAGGIVTINGQVQRPPVIDYKLADVPELGYYRTDSPHPRGELLIKTKQLFPGYYRRPEITAEMFDEDGFYRTGDIMAEVEPDHLEYVDRTKNVLKLSQGEFVTVAAVQSVLTQAPLVRQIFVYGNSERSYLLAVVVPTPDAVERNAGSEPALRAAIAESLRRRARDAGLASYEVPRDFLIETEPFTQANGLLSDVGKTLAPRLRERYGERLEQLYAELAAGQDAQLSELRRTGRDRPVLETIGKAAQALLGCAGTDVRPDAHFTDLGGDSLSALTISTLLEEIFGVPVPVGVVTSPATDLRALAAYVEAERASTATRPTFATVHGANATEVRATELTLDRFLDADTLAATRDLPPAAETANTVLLTGSTGYLGRFLCLEWMRRLDERGGRVIAVVRGRDAESARERLDAAFDSGDEELARRYAKLAADTLEVLPGDIGEPRFGLDEQTWNRLATEVDLIVHPAALVNHVLPYDQLFGPNVAGTAEVIRLALTSRLKPVTYLSTVGVAGQASASALDEDADIRATNPVRRVDDSYASGYGTSKWAGEVLLREAHDLCALPVAVFRSDMILAHSAYTGQLNLPDMFTRLLFSLAVTGIAPYSFYLSGAGEPRPRAHYDGLPVDFTAAAVTELGERATTGFATYNTVNPHDDGVSLDVVVDWLTEAGRPIERIDDYADWFVRLETALRGLPENRRQYTLLPLLHAYAAPDLPIPGSVIPATRFRAAVRSAGIGTDGDIPHLSAELIAKYVSDLTHLRVL